MLLVATACAQDQPTRPPTTLDYSHPSLLVTTRWLEEHLGSPDLVLLDARSAEEYGRGHIPGAVLADETLTWDPNSKVDRVVGPQEVIKDVFESLGVSDSSQVVVYDDVSSLWASRIFWLLDYYGLQRIAILNGGFFKWQDVGRAVTADVPQVNRGSFNPLAQPEKLATQEYIMERLDDVNVGICDTRSLAEYEGRDLTIPQRPGHIPGSQNVEWLYNLNPDGTFKSQLELERLYTDAGLTPDKEVIPLCQTGVRSAHTYFALRLIGYPRVRLYDASYEEWGMSSSLTPVKRDAVR
ncbi:MAG: sulfurtransferase [Dehalococcoidia bacterium]|nr:sulfurtransferase [Dehalococcoidia bacterium]